MTAAGPDDLLCPICGAPAEAGERYPTALCVPCSSRATDGEGRAMRFGNQTALGAGFVAEVDDGGAWRRVESGACVVDGRPCVAQEHRFGGIVIQAVDG